LLIPQAGDGVDAAALFDPLRHWPAQTVPKQQITTGSPRSQLVGNSARMWKQIWPPTCVYPGRGLSALIAKYIFTNAYF
jgi:hypothetical protein